MPGKADEARGRIALLEKDLKHTAENDEIRAQTKSDRLDDPAMHDPHATVGPHWKQVGDAWVDTSE